MHSLRTVYTRLPLRSHADQLLAQMYNLRNTQGGRNYPGCFQLVSIWQPPMDISEFPSQKRAIFRKIKEIKELRGDVPWYVKPEITQIDPPEAEQRAVSGRKRP